MKQGITPILGLGLLILGLMVSCGEKEEGAMGDANKDGLRGKAKIHGLELGVAVDFNRLSRSPYGDLVRSEFNAITAENVMKWETIQPQQGSFEWFFADSLADFAQANGMKLRGHTLIWHSQLPSWVSKVGTTKEAVLDLVRTHVRTIVDHYKGRVHKWDVVNEVIADPQGMRPSVFYDQTGTEFIHEAFRTAHGADPKALLYINDYSIEEINPKSTALYELCKELLANKVPIHGVGMQSHWDLGDLPSMESVRQNIQRFVDLGLRVDITELDVRIKSPATPEDLAKQAEVYAQVFDLVLKTPGTDTVVIWGLDDGSSWVSGWKPSHGSATIFDKSYQPKPAYQAIEEVLSSGGGT